MRAATIVLGLLLVAAGALTLGYEAITYTAHPDVIELGPLTATTDATSDRIPLPPILGALGLVAGLGVILLGTRSRSTPSSHNT